MPHRLSSLLVQERVVDVQTMHAAFQRVSDRGGRLGTALMELEAVDPETLARYLGQVSGLPSAMDGLLRVAHDAVLEKVPSELAVELGICPLRSDGEIVRIVVSDPLTPSNLHNIESRVGASVEQHIATQLRVRQSLAAYYGVPLTARLRALSERYPLETTRSGSAPREKAPTPHVEYAVPSGDVEPPAFDPQADDVPGLEWTFSELLAFYATSPSRDELLLATLGYAGKFLSRRMLLVVGSTHLKGYALQGGGEAAERIRDAALPYAGNAALATVCRGTSYYLGDIAEIGFDALYTQLGLPHPPDCLVLPVRVGPRAALLLTGDGDDEPVSPKVVAILSFVLRRLSRHLVRLIQERKRARAAGREVRSGSTPAIRDTGARFTAGGQYVDDETQRVLDTLEHDTAPIGRGVGELPRQSVDLERVLSDSTSSEAIDSTAPLGQSSRPHAPSHEGAAPEDARPISEIGQEGAAVADVRRLVDRAPQATTPDDVRREDESSLHEAIGEQASLIQSGAYPSVHPEDSQSSELPSQAESGRFEPPAARPDREVTPDTDQSARPAAASDALDAVSDAEDDEARSSQELATFEQSLEEIEAAFDVIQRPTGSNEAVATKAEEPELDISGADEPDAGRESAAQDEEPQERADQAQEPITGGAAPSVAADASESEVEDAQAKSPEVRAAGRVDRTHLLAGADETVSDALAAVERSGEDGTPEEQPAEEAESDRAAARRIARRQEGSGGHRSYTPSGEVQIRGVIPPRDDAPDIRATLSPLDDVPTLEASEEQIDRLRQLSEELRSGEYSEPWLRSVIALESDNPDEVDAAFRQLVDAGAEPLPSLVKRFPGRLLLDPFDVEALSRPVEEHGPLLAVIVQMGNIATPALVELFDDEDRTRRFYAVYLFTRIEDPEVIGPMAERLFDREVRIRDLAQRILDHYRANERFEMALRAIRARLGTGSVSERVRAINGLAHFTDAESVPALIEAVGSDEERVRVAAVGALERITFQRYGDNKRRWERWYHQMGLQERSEWLLDAMVDSDRNVRDNAARALRAMPRLVVNYHADIGRDAREAARLAVARHFNRV